MNQRASQSNLNKVRQWKMLKIRQIQRTQNRLKKNKKKLWTQTKNRKSKSLSKSKKKRKLTKRLSTLN